MEYQSNAGTEPNPGARYRWHGDQLLRGGGRPVRPRLGCHSGGWEGAAPVLRAVGSVPEGLDGVSCRGGDIKTSVPAPPWRTQLTRPTAKSTSWSSAQSLAPRSRGAGGPAGLEQNRLFIPWNADDMNHSHNWAVWSRVSWSCCSTDRRWTFKHAQDAVATQRKAAQVTRGAASARVQACTCLCQPL